MIFWLFVQCMLQRSSWNKFGTLSSTLINPKPPLIAVSNTCLDIVQSHNSALHLGICPRGHVSGGLDLFFWQSVCIHPIYTV